MTNLNLTKKFEASTLNVEALKQDALKSRVMNAIVDHASAAGIHVPAAAAGFDFTLHVGWKNAQGQAIQ